MINSSISASLSAAAGKVSPRCAPGRHAMAMLREAGLCSAYMQAPGFLLRFAPDRIHSFKLDFYPPHTIRPQRLPGPHKTSSSDAMPSPQAARRGGF
jgi:hypothetical protein